MDNASGRRAVRGWASRSARILVLFVCALALPALAADFSLSEGTPPTGSGGGEHTQGEPKEHLTEAQRREIWQNIRRNVDRLGLARSAAQPRLAPPTFGWPMVPNGIADPGYHGISNFVDQAIGSGIMDYSCGARSYNGHQGTDFFLWPFPWLKMDNNQVRVVAGAPGTIVYRTDGNYDRSCTVNNNLWNAIYVQHADGSIAWYGHLKNGSVTSKSVGAGVVQGEYLGVVGSSGSSTGPHLHMEVYDASGNLIDPYQGSCNALNLSSWWASQRPYYDSAVNRLMTGSAPAFFPSCPGAETTNEKTAFRYGQPAYFTAFYRDQLSSQTSQYRILRPNGTVYSAWTHSGPAAHYSASWWYWSWGSFAPSGPSGTWTFEVTFNGQVSTRTFTLSP